MAHRNWRIGLLGLIASTLVAGCLPQAKELAGQAPAQGASNTAPTIGGTPTVSATAGTAWQFQPSAYDADGDLLVFTATGLPGWANINRTTGLVWGTPPAGSTGSTSQIVVTVTDGEASASLVAFSVSISSTSTIVPTPGIGTAALTWTPPDAYIDGSPLPAAELTAFRIYHGTSAATLSRVAEVDSGSRAFTVNSLPAGTHYFAVTAVTATGVESTYSRLGSKTIL
jgi:hypothetical protein